jgi:hypothetical protein
MFHSPVRCPSDLRVLVLVKGVLWTIFYVDGSKYETLARNTGTANSHSIMNGIILPKPNSYRKRT